MGSPSVLRVVSLLIVLGTIATTLHLGSVVFKAVIHDAAADGVGSSMFAHDADDGTGGERGLPPSERRTSNEEAVEGRTNNNMPRTNNDEQENILIISDTANGAAILTRRRTQSKHKEENSVVLRSSAEERSGEKGSGLPKVEYPSVAELTSLQWYHRNYNNTRYRSLQTQKEVYWGRPKVHGRCSKLIFAVRGSGFQLMTMHGPTLSVEQKLVETFVGLQERQRLISDEAAAAKSGQCGSSSVHGSSSPRVPRLVMDLGVNDGEDTVTWYNAFGRLNESCSKYVLLEPQQNYAHNIHCAVEKNYFSSPLSEFPKRRVAGLTIIGSEGELAPTTSTDASPLAAAAEEHPKYVTAPCGNLTAEEWKLISGKYQPAGLVDATWEVFKKPSKSTILSNKNDEDDRHIINRRAEFLEKNRVLYFKAAAATMPNQHLTSIVMSGSGEQAAVVVKQQASEISNPNPSAAAAAGNRDDGETQGQERTTLLSLAELYSKLTSTTISQTTKIVGGGGQAVSPSSSPSNSSPSSSSPESLRHRISQLASNPARISLLKIDCEGADPSIVMGAWELFASQRVDILIIEAHKNNYMIEGAFPYNYTEAVAMLRFYGYRTFLIGFFHAFDSFVFLEIDAAFMMLWRPNLETIVALPGVPLDGRPFLLYQPGVAKRMTKKMVTGFFIAGSRMNVETSNYWGRVRNEGHYMSCLMNVYLVRCPVCGGERSLRSKKKYGG